MVGRATGQCVGQSTKRARDVRAYADEVKANEVTMWGNLQSLQARSGYTSSSGIVVQWVLADVRARSTECMQQSGSKRGDQLWITRGSDSGAIQRSILANPPQGRVAAALNASALHPGRVANGHGSSCQPWSRSQRCQAQLAARFITSCNELGYMPPWLCCTKPNR